MGSLILYCVLSYIIVYSYFLDLETLEKYNDKPKITKYEFYVRMVLVFISPLTFCFIIAQTLSIINNQ